MTRVVCLSNIAAFLALWSLPAGECLAQEKGDAALNFKIAYATYLGGSESEEIREVIPYPDGSVLVGGQTDSPDLPTTPGVVQPKYAGEPAGTGHSGVFGGDCFLGRLSPDGGKLVFATYFGGSKQERNTYGMGLDSKGNIVIASMTRSPDLPTTERAFQRKFGGGDSDWMAAKLSPDCQKILWCTYVGGCDQESPRGGLAIDADDYVYLVGETFSKDFPTSAGAFQRERKGNCAAGHRQTEA